MNGTPAAARATPRILGIVAVAVVAIGAGSGFAWLDDTLSAARLEHARDEAYTRKRVDAMAAELARLADTVALGPGARSVERGPPPTAAGSGSTAGEPPPLAASELHALRAELERALAAREAAARELEEAGHQREFLERRLEESASARTLAERDRDELARQLALRVTSDAAAAGSTRAPATPPRPALEGPALEALVARIDEYLSHDGRTPRLRFLSARALVGETFEDVVLEERAIDGAVSRRIEASRASFELYQAIRLVRVRLATCHLAEAPSSGGRELRLPELAVERYDVDVKSWRELARETTVIWLALR